jgi:hemolysin-activating ACP:hemolysin acyltransferase
MENLTIIDETDQYVWAREKDDLRAMAILCMIASGSRLYGEEPLFLFYDRMRCGVETGQYGILYERTEPEAPIAMPVAFMSWAKLSKPVETMFVNRMRPMSREEWRSGKNLWVIDNCAPYAAGHFEIARKFLEAMFATHQFFNYTKVKNGKVSRARLANRAYEADE